MTVSNTRFIILATIVCAVVVLFDNKVVSGQCQGDVQGLMQQCSRYVQKSGPKTEPSQGCCGVVKTVDLPCVCNHITDKVEQIISMEKAAYVAKSCGKPLAHGTKCGSYTVP
ncbi:hypothetical protein RJ640_012328 [Escallonia rubra]|uniref:Bifunctional inhibitor/plant lipid transfer protein/seed storage helical domain-containing protein n=1 Tax=Escallonia rubra TaxID=112253 RepID=A0AA88RJ20_9ASTE|nr:hypothetical protein RJ640_012328 [Escallonia rubra]